MTEDTPIEHLAGEALERANEIYAEIHFPASDPERDQTFGILEDGEPFALARIHRAEDGSN